MNIPDEAVQVALDVPVVGGRENYIRSILTAAAPFLQGVKVKALEWVGKTEIKAKAIIGTYLIDQFAEKFRLYSLDRSSYQWFDTLEAAKAAAQADYAARVRSAIEVSAPAPSPRAQALEELEKYADEKTAIAFSRMMEAQRVNDTDFADAMEKERNAYSDMTMRIRAISSQPVVNGLPQDVINLVIAAREAWDTWQLPEEEFKRLDTALEAFAIRVPYEDEPEALPASPGASE